MIRAVLVDDEEPARDRLRGMLASFDDVRVVGEAGDGEDAIRQIAESRPNLVFLDIQMPGLTGMEVARSLQPPRPRLVFCTAFDRYAIEAFEHHAVDYLLKPLNRARLRTAIDRVRESMGEQEQHRRELADARHVQTRLFPQAPPATTTLEYSGVCRPARGVGGDYYDFLPVGEHQLGLAVADVSGKGMYAGLLMASLQGQVQSLATRHGAALDGLVGEVNRLMYAFTDTDKYVTLFYGLYDDRTRELTYVNAGHVPPLLFRPSHPGAAAGDHVRQLQPNGMVIGLMAEEKFPQGSVQLARGDVLLVFTDGVTEAVNDNEEEFGQARLEELVNQHWGRSASELRDVILREVDQFRGTDAQQDDITLVVAKVL